MIQVCSVCKIVYGEKEPFEDKRLTHDYCPDCFKVVMAEIKKNASLLDLSPRDGKVLGLAKDSIQPRQIKKALVWHWDCGA